MLLACCRPTCGPNTSVTSLPCHPASYATRQPSQQQLLLYSSHADAFWLRQTRGVRYK